MNRRDRTAQEVIPASEEEISRVCEHIEQLFAPHMQDKLMKTLCEASLVVAREGLLHD